MLDKYLNLAHPCLKSFCENTECQKWKHTLLIYRSQLLNYSNYMKELTNVIES